MLHLLGVGRYHNRKYGDMLLCNTTITGMPKATLGDAVKELRKSISIHPAFEAALQKLYGYTSDADGIRHALLGDENLTLIDAKFMLVLSAGFVSYLIGKTGEAGHAFK